MIEQYIVNRTMNLIEKLGSYDYFLKKTQGELKVLKYEPESYMIRKPNGKLAQEVATLQPVYTKWKQGQ